jgi:hypothetical protein
MMARGDQMLGFQTLFCNIIILISLLLLAATPSGASEKINCDIQRGSCMQVTTEGSRIEFDIQPKPVTVMRELSFTITITRNGKPAKDVSASLDLSMPGMFMGKNRPVLEKAGDGIFRGTGVIIRCASGRKTWQAEIVVERGGKTDVADFVFEVK